MAGSKYDKLFSPEEREVIVNDYIKNGLSIRKICDKYGIKSSIWAEKLIGKKSRSSSEAGKLAHSLYPEKFKHTDETKKKLSEIRLKFMREHPEETAWRKKGKTSYPEKCFIKFLEDYGYDKKYYIEREKSIFPYYIDFAFVDEKIAVEIDGSQHVSDNERKERDRKKDELLIGKGWTILRFTENLVKTDWTTMKNEIDSVLTEHPSISKRVGIFKCKAKMYEKVQRGKKGLSEKQKKSAIKQRKVKNRPTKEELIQRLSTMSFEALSREYGISSNAIRKWCRGYEIPYHIKEIRDMAGSYNG